MEESCGYISGRGYSESSTTNMHSQAVADSFLSICSILPVLSQGLSSSYACSAVAAMHA